MCQVVSFTPKHISQHPSPDVADLLAGSYQHLFLSCQKKKSLPSLWFLINFLLKPF